MEIDCVAIEKAKRKAEVDDDGMFAAIFTEMFHAGRDMRRAEKRSKVT